MDIKDFQREKTLTEIIAERDAMILNLLQEVQRLTDRLKSENKEAK